MKKVLGFVKSNRLMALTLAMTVLFGMSVGVREATAYLTSRAATSGYVALNLTDTWTDLDEEVANWEKRITIMNDGEGACKIRVKLFVAQKYEPYVTYASDNAGWTLESDGYWYYSEVLEPGEKAPVLLAKIDSAKFSQSFIEAGTEDFNIIVVHEYARVQYDNLGRAFVDWNEKAIADAE